MIEHFYASCDLDLFCKCYIVFYTWMQKKPHLVGPKAPIPCPHKSSSAYTCARFFVSTHRRRPATTLIGPGAKKNDRSSKKKPLIKHDFYVHICTDNSNPFTIRLPCRTTGAHGWVNYSIAHYFLTSRNAHTRICIRWTRQTLICSKKPINLFRVSEYNFQSDQIVNPNHFSNRLNSIKISLVV
jgi:hypothetical protein